MMVGIAVHVGEVGAGHGADGVRHRRQRAGVAALADVGDALDNHAERPYTTGGMRVLPVGKLRAEALQAVFDQHPIRDPRVVVGPRVGEDAAVIDLGDRYLIATADPITFVAEDLARYALVVNANDVAVRGARPRWFLATLLLPEGATSEATVGALFDALHAACDELDVTLVGGHTEVTHGLDRPIVAGTMLGEVAKDKLVTTGGARVGDAVVMTKGVPLEGAAIIARAREAVSDPRVRFVAGDLDGAERGLIMARRAIDRALRALARFD